MAPATVQSGYERWLDATGAARWDRLYKPFPQQRKFHTSPAKYRLFGGAAGPGKSKALLMEGVFQAHDFPNVNTLLLRRTFPELDQSLLLYFRRDIPRELYKDFNESRHVVTWHNGSTTRFGYCAREADVYQYQGAEFLFIGLDELTMFELRQWQFLTSRNRCPVEGSRPTMAGATNPGNRGHSWVKSLWIDKQAAAQMEHPELYDASDYDFVPAKLSDNPVYAKDEAYVKTLRMLPTHLRRAFLEGDWGVFAGQYFDIFSPAVMCVRAEDVRQREWWPRWISCDWGFEHPSVIHWHTTDDSGRVITYREYKERHKTPKELGDEIARRSTRRDDSGVERPENILSFYLSPDAFASRTGEATIAEQIGDVMFGYSMPRPQLADNDRVGGWMHMYQSLKNGDWLITDNCMDLIKCLPTLVRDEVDIEDIAKVDGDDSADCARYGLYSQRRKGTKPIEVKVVERVQKVIEQRAEQGLPKIVDPTSYAMMVQKAEHEERKRLAPVRLIGSARRRFFGRN